MTALQQCQSELADASAPSPSWMEEDLLPAAALYYTWEVNKVALTIATAAMASLGDDVDIDDPTVHNVLNGVSAAVAGLTVALVALDVLPKEAEEAITSGKPA
jgi:hypothetical protein